MSKKKVVVALGHRALGTTMPEQYKATRKTAKAIADLVEAGADVVISHSNAPQVGMIHTAMNEFSKEREDYTQAPMSVCSAMSQGYVGYDLQNAIRAELLKRGVYRPVCTIITQVMVDPYDDAFTEPVKVIGRLLSKEEAEQEEKHGNYVTEVEGGYRRIVAAPKPQGIIEIDSIKALSDQGQVVIACGGGGIPVLAQGVELHGASAVIEKDYASGRMAELLNADALMILTSVEHVCVGYNTDQEVPLEHMLVDNCAMQLVKDPAQFDVVLTENMFGDILSDEASMVTGSIGMLASASLNDTKFGLYEPSGGSAPDIAGKGIANPIATILSAAMMLRFSFDLDKEADAIENAVAAVLKDGYRTIDIMSEGKEQIGTAQMGDKICEYIK